MNIVHAFFMVSFLVSVSILLCKVYNLLSVGEWYDVRTGFMLFIGYLIAWLVSMVCVLMDLTTPILNTLFKLQTWFILINVIALIAELFLLAKVLTQPAIKPYMSNQVEYRR